MRRTLVLTTGLVLLAGAGASQPVPSAPAGPSAPAATAAPTTATTPQPGIASPFKNMLPVKDVMRHIVNPAAELYWKDSGEIDTAEGEQHRVPAATDDARWGAAIDAAMTLEEAGNLLMMQGRARDDKQWMRYAQMLSDAGVQAIAAAQARDEQKTFDAGSALYNACYACHGRYIPRPKNSLYSQHLPDDAFKPPK
jgi:hypothetical protein